jgi:GNAT superfamily N-acetyltransferase
MTTPCPELEAEQPVDRTPTLEMKALVDDNIEQRIVYYGTTGSVPFRRDTDAVWLTTGIPVSSAFLNHIWRANSHTPAEIDSIIQRAHMMQYPLFMVVHPDHDSDTLRATFASRGLRMVGALWPMGLDLAQAQPPRRQPANLDIRRVETEATLAAFLRVLDHDSNDAGLARWLALEATLGFTESQNWQRFIGYQNGEPVATVAVFFSSTAAGIYHVETIESARGQGIGSVMTYHAMRWAQQHGYTRSVLISTPMGYNVYERLGFRVLDKLLVFGSTPH